MRWLCKGLAHSYLNSLFAHPPLAAFRVKPTHWKQTVFYLEPTLTMCQVSVFKATLDSNVCTYLYARVWWIGWNMHMLTTSKALHVDSMWIHLHT